MATKIDWDDVENSGKNRGKGSGTGVRFVKFVEGKTETLRLVGEAVQFLQFFANGKSVIVDPEVKEQAQALIEDAVGKECKPKKRYAYNVINREDGQIWILTGGPQIFKNFASWSKMMQEELELAEPPAAGGKHGCNWKIRAEGAGLNREYHTNYGMKQAPFTAEEIDVIGPKGANLYKLTDIFKETELDEVVAKILGQEPVAAAKSNSSNDDAVVDNDSDLDF